MYKYFLEIVLDRCDDDGESFATEKNFIPVLFDDDDDELIEWMQDNSIKLCNDYAINENDKDRYNIYKAKEEDIELTEDGLKCEKYEYVGSID